MWRRILTAALGAVALVAAAPALAQATSISEFKLTPTNPNTMPVDVAGGPDGNLWFTDGGTTHAIGKITPSGTITEYTQGLTHGPPNFITLGPDGNLWFTELGPSAAIGKITPSGAITEFPLGAGHSGDAILVGPDKNIWFLDTGANEIGRVIPSSGTITEFGTGSGMNGGAQLNAMDTGPDGNIWFTDQGSTKAIGRLSISAPDASPTKIHEFTDPTLQLPVDITGGSDGNVWFTDNNAHDVGRITPSGTFTFYGIGNGLQASGMPDGITLGPDGNIWFTDSLGGGNPRMVGKVVPSAPAAKQIVEYPLTLQGAEDSISGGADGNLWVEQANDNTPGHFGSIARITPSGTVTEFTTGLLPNANQDNDNIISGPDGNIWFNDRGAKAIGKVSLQLPATATTGAASAVTSTSATVAGTVEPFGAPTAVTFRYGTTPSLGSTASAGTLAPSTNTSPVTASLTGLPGKTTIYYQVVADNGSGAATGAVKTFTTLPTPPPPITTTTTKIGDQQITLTTPSLQICTANAKTLSATLTSTAIKGSRAAKLRFARAAFFIDRGVKHTRKRIRHLSHGRRKTVTITFFTAEATVHRVPATVNLSLKGLRSGTHTLKVVVSYRQTITKHGKRKTVTVTKTLSARFRVC